MICPLFETGSAETDGALPVEGCAGSPINDPAGDLPAHPANSSLASFQAEAGSAGDVLLPAGLEDPAGGDEWDVGDAWDDLDYPDAPSLHGSKRDGTRKCRKCGTVKPFAEYDGDDRKCRACYEAPPPPGPVALQVPIGDPTSLPPVCRPGYVNWSTLPQDAALCDHARELVPKQAELIAQGQLVKPWEGFPAGETWAGWLVYQHTDITPGGLVEYFRDVILLFGLRESLGQTHRGDANDRHRRGRPRKENTNDG